MEAITLFFNDLSLAECIESITKLENAAISSGELSAHELAEAHYASSRILVLLAQLQAVALDPSKESRGV